MVFINIKEWGGFCSSIVFSTQESIEYICIGYNIGSMSFFDLDGRTFLSHVSAKFKERERERRKKN